MEGIVKSEIGKNLMSAFLVNGGNSAREAVGGSEGLSPWDLLTSVPFSGCSVENAALTPSILHDPLHRRSGSWIDIFESPASMSTFQGIHT